MNNNILKTIKDALSTGSSVLAHFMENEENCRVILDMARNMAECFSGGGKVLTCGNGGSACEAFHLAEEFAGRYRKHRRALPVIALVEPAYLTCVANDYGFEDVFSRGVEAYGQPGDILVGLSTSGNSSNVVKAVEAADKAGLKTFLFLGRDGGKLKGKGSCELIVEAETTDRIQELHMISIHVLIESVERILFPENYSSSR